MRTEIVVGMADMKISQGDQLIATYALGSCIGLCVYDEVMQVGGLLHAMLPNMREKTGEPFRYVDTGISAMIQELCRKGAAIPRMKAKLVGGARMFEFNMSTDGRDIGSKNVFQAHQSLKQYGIPVVWEVTGGTESRTIRFQPCTGMVKILSSARPEEII